MNSYPPFIQDLAEAVLEALPQTDRAEDDPLTIKKIVPQGRLGGDGEVWVLSRCLYHLHYSSSAPLPCLYTYPPRRQDPGHRPRDGRRVQACARQPKSEESEAPLAPARAQGHGHLWRRRRLHEARVTISLILLHRWSCASLLFPEGIINGALNCLQRHRLPGRMRALWNSLPGMRLKSFFVELLPKNTTKTVRHEDFPRGHPPQYYSRPIQLDCRGLMGSGMFWMV